MGLAARQQYQQPGEETSDGRTSDVRAIMRPAGTIAGLWTANLLRAAEAAGISKDSLAGVIAVDESRRNDPSYRIPEHRHLELWAHIMRQVDDPSMPIRYAQRMHVDDYDTLGLLCKTSPNLGVALERLSRFIHLWVDNQQCRLEVRDTAMLILSRPGPRSLGLRSANESGVAEVLKMMRDIVGQHIRPVRVYFSHPKPSSVAAHEEFFGCELQFGTAFDAIELEGHWMDAELKLGDAGLSSFLLKHLEHLEEQGIGAKDLTSRVRNSISNAFPGGPPRIEEVAQELGTSVRTLQRHLSGFGTSFQALVEEIRIELAARLVSDSSRSLGEIAFLLGFSEPSAFHRAFRRWNGETPQQYRVRVNSSSAA